VRLARKYLAIIGVFHIIRKKEKEAMMPIVKKFTTYAFVTLLLCGVATAADRMVIGEMFTNTS
jgi:hypothetical protein